MFVFYASEPNTFRFQFTFSFFTILGDFGNGKVPLQVEIADDDGNVGHMTHYLHQILEQVRHGHVTQATVDEWKRKLNHALHTGLLTQDQYNEFKNQVRAELFSQTTNNEYCSSCIFWVG